MNWYLWLSCVKWELFTDVPLMSLSPKMSLVPIAQHAFYYFLKKKNWEKECIADGSCLYCNLQFEFFIFFLQLGAAAVNLVAGEKPADVYSGIAARWVFLYIVLTCSFKFEILKVGIFCIAVIYLSSLAIYL